MSPAEPETSVNIDRTGYSSLEQINMYMVLLLPLPSSGQQGRAALTAFFKKWSRIRGWNYYLSIQNMSLAN